GALSGEGSIRYGTKTRWLPRRHSYERSRHRHCREATKLGPCCLMRVRTTINGEALMKRLLLGAAAIVAFAAPAFAADVPPRTYTKAPVYTAPQVVYNWTGFYIGGPVAGVPAGFTTDATHKDGYTVGAGLEYMFAPNWSARAEYQYYNFGTTTFTSGPAPIVGSHFRDDEHTVKVGVNYRFGWG